MVMCIAMGRVGVPECPRHSEGHSRDRAAYVFLDVVQRQQCDVVQATEDRR